MTYTGLFDEDKKEKQIKKLKEDIKNQKIINTEHQKLNGKLRLEIEKLKKENEILYEGNDVLGIYVGGGVKEQLKKIVKSMIKDIEVATPLIRKNPKGILFKTSIQSLARYAKRLNDLYQEMVKKIN
tara:strand:+ start:161 stop:541 length:381 start_codon:yes stop_codon:yes gene_type:complete